MTDMAEPIEDTYIRIMVAIERDEAAGLLVRPVMPHPDHHPRQHVAAMVAFIVTYAQRSGCARYLELSEALRKHGEEVLAKRFNKRHPDLTTWEDIERWAHPPTGPKSPGPRLLDLG
jgi:hypothetical protein